jgi:hypothetical protein
VTYSLVAFASPVPFPRLRNALRLLGREASALLNALTSPVAFVAEVEALRAKPKRTR